MWQYKHTDELYHYGVPGMRWGKRKGTSSEQKTDENSRASKGKSTAAKILAGIGIAAVATVAVGAAVKYGKPAASAALKSFEHIAPNWKKSKASSVRWSRYAVHKIKSTTGNN